MKPYLALVYKRINGISTTQTIRIQRHPDMFMKGLKEEADRCNTVECRKLPLH